MMMVKKYDIVSKGEIVTGFTCDSVKQSIGESLKLTRAQANHICSSEMVVLKSNVDLDFAQKIQKLLYSKGLKVHLIECTQEKAAKVNQAESFTYVRSVAQTQYGSLYNVVSKGEIVSGFT